MALLPPRVIGPLSECSTRVRVQAQLTGADGHRLRQWRAGGERRRLLVRPDLPADDGAAARPERHRDADASAWRPAIASPEPVAGAGQTAGRRWGRVSQPPEPVRRVRVARRARAGRQGRAARRRRRAGQRRELRRQRPPPPVDAARGGHGRSRRSRTRAASPGTITNGPPVDMVVEKLRTLPTPIVADAAARVRTRASPSATSSMAPRSR